MNKEFEQELEKAASKAFQELFQTHDEHFYYCSLITSEMACPYICAWSDEALKMYCEESNITSEEEVLDYKWSYADSPYCAYGWDYFEEVERLFVCENTADMDTEEYDDWTIGLLECMERVMHNLDENGLFGTGAKRRRILVNAEVMPPDYTNTERALRLNKKEDIEDWLNEAAEE